MSTESAPRFTTADGLGVPAVTTAQMREIDRAAVEELGLGLLQMMENAGRSLAELAVERTGSAVRRFTILAGGGGNGGGGLCCARHLLNHGSDVFIVLDRPPEALKGAARSQYQVLHASGRGAHETDDVAEVLSHSTLVIDALIGYSLRGAPRGRASELIELCNHHAKDVLSLDVPSGMDATRGDSPGVSVQADATLTLALPKTGLVRSGGELFLADIGIPALAFERIGIPYASPFGDSYRVRLRAA